MTIRPSSIGHKRDFYFQSRRVSALCVPCLRGDHSKNHSPIGCIEVTGPARTYSDFVCKCVEPGVETFILSGRSPEVNEVAV